MLALGADALLRAGTGPNEAGSCGSTAKGCSAAYRRPGCPIMSGPAFGGRAIPISAMTLRYDGRRALLVVGRGPMGADAAEHGAGRARVRPPCRWDDRRVPGLG